ncbi:MAG: glycine zipper 2TM domain-containing protein [Proteobacteria bacterium]|nr:glycine zipper 2TM domain-containing protein [Pseudomonadota bacterium]
MRISAILAIAGAIAATVVVSGCASTSSGSVYSGAQTRGEQTVRMGVVESVRQVTIEGSRSGVGTLAGGAVGGVAGSNIGGGSRGSAIGTILGAVAGGVAGNAIEQGTSQKPGLEITVKLDNGELRAITQDADEVFRAGERVRLLSGGGVTRVTH